MTRQPTRGDLHRRRQLVKRLSAIKVRLAYWRRITAWRIRGGLKITKQGVTAKRWIKGWDRS